MKGKLQKSDHLFICMTPLHILIAEKIIEREKIGSFVMVYYYYKETDKILHYYNRLASRAQASFFIRKQNSLATSVVVLYKLSGQIKKCFSSQGTLYCGNIKTIYSRLPVFFLGVRNLYTFDDGIGNVSGQGYFYQNREPAWYNRVLRAFGMDISYSRFYRSIKKHYTIYKSANAMPHCEYLPVFDFDTRLMPGTQAGGIAVLLTSTLSEDGMMVLDLEKKLYTTIIRDFKVRYVIPHPLEQTVKIEDKSVEIITSTRIAEEIIMDLRREHENVTIIGWYSSALVHLAGVPGISAVNVTFHSTLSMDTPKAFFESQNVRSYNPVMDF